MLPLQRIGFKAPVGV